MVARTRSDGGTRTLGCWHARPRAEAGSPAGGRALAQRDQRPGRVGRVPGADAGGSGAQCAPSDRPRWSEL